MPSAWGPAEKDRHPTVASATRPRSAVQPEAPYTMGVLSHADLIVLVHAVEGLEARLAKWRSKLGALRSGVHRLVAVYRFIAECSPPRQPSARRPDPGPVPVPVPVPGAIIRANKTQVAGVGIQPRPILCPRVRRRFRAADRRCDSRRRRYGVPRSAGRDRHSRQVAEQRFRG